jgi:hypothetical protein
MKHINKFSILCLLLMAALCFGQTAFAAKTLSVGTASVSNAGVDDAARTATLDVTLKGGANDVNGLVFTLIYNKDVFTFDGLVKNGMDIDDGTIYDALEVQLKDDPDKASKLAATIAKTLYYQTNNKATEGIVLIAAAAANFFTDSATADFIPFKAKFIVNANIGNGRYPIGIQKTIIGPLTAANAGYTTPTALAVAAGLDPTKEPTTAQSYEVGFLPGLITVLGGYDVTGPVVYGSDPEAFADGATANLIQVLANGNFKIDSQVVKDGKYTFAKVSNGTYKIEILSTKPGYQKRAISGEVKVEGANEDVPKITLVKYAAKSGQVTINDSELNLSGLRVEIRDGSTIIGTAAVDATGNYVTPPLPVPMTYTLWAIYGNAEVDITNDPAYDWTLSLGTVSGTLTGLCDDQEVEVFIRSDTTTLKKSVLITGAGASNTYILPNLLPGIDYILSVVGEGIGPVYYDNTEVFTNATKVVVTGGADNPGRDFAFTCNDLVTISGTVTVDGNTVDGATVKANNFNFTTWKFGSAVTAGGGNFEIKVAKSNDYYVYFVHNGQTYYYKDGATEAVSVRSEATHVDVTAVSAVGVNIPVLIPIPDTAKLEGDVTLNRSMDNGGIPLVNYLVTLSSPDNLFIARTNGQGSYLFENMPPATYNVTLLPPSPYARQVVKDVVLTNGTTAETDFIVDQNYEVTGLVMDASDGTTPVGSARVDIIKSNGQKLRSAVFTDPLGSYTLVDIPSGVYTMIASHKDYFPKSNDETVLADLTAATLFMVKGAIIEGTVSDDAAPPVVVPDATVTLRGQAYAKSTKTNALGKYQFRGLAASSPHIIKVAKGTTYAPFVPEDVDTGTADLPPVTKDLTLKIPVTDWTFDGTVTKGGSAVANAYVKLWSVTTKYTKVVKTTAAGAFIFTHVIQDTDYSLLVIPGLMDPILQEDNITIDADMTHPAVVVPTSPVISGTITLSVADATAIVLAGAYDPATGSVQRVRAANPSGDNKIFTYEIKVNTGVAYNVFAQDLFGTFPYRYYVSAGVSGTHSEATDLTAPQSGIDILLIK